MALAGTELQRFPTDRGEKRRFLLASVASVADVVTAHADDAEAMGTLHPAVVAALSEAGLFALKLPAELGGAEADPVTQLDVIEAMTYLDTSAGWAMMIGATGIGWPGAYLPDAAIEVIFADGRIPMGAGSGAIAGTATVTDGGYRLSGRFRFCSGIHHADWLHAAARILDADAQPIGERFLVFPKSSAVVHEDSWDVAGLHGTGSCDFSTSDLFVPVEFSWDRAILAMGKPVRGGPIFRLGMPAFVANEHMAFALGGARRALDLVIDIATTKRRGVSPNPIAERPVFQSFLARSDTRLRAVRARAVECLEDAWNAVCAGSVPGPRLQAEIRATSVYVVEECVDIVTQAFRFAGGRALQSSDLLQRYWRDVTASGQHIAVNDEGYEAYGRHLLGMELSLAGTAGNGNAR